MYLSEIFDQLTYGELFHLEIGGGHIGGIDPKYYPSLVANMNSALTALHTRFFLKKNELIVQQYENIQTYILDKKFAKSNVDSTEPIKYIEDSIYRPFNNDLLKVEQIFDEGGEEISLNDIEDTLSIHTPSFNTLQIPYPHPDNSISVLYRADHIRLNILEDFDPNIIEIDISWSLMEPLLFYMAHRFLSVNGMQGSGQDSINYLNKYNASCNKIEVQGLINKPETTNTKLEAAGWR